MLFGMKFLTMEQKKFSKISLPFLMWCEIKLVNEEYLRNSSNDLSFICGKTISNPPLVMICYLCLLYTQTTY